MARITCSYCEADVDEDAVEKDGGYCPECGMIMGMTSSNSDKDPYDEDEDDDDEEEDDDELYE